MTTNEVKGIASQVTDGTVGSLNDLNTTSKANVVAAVNEIEVEVSGIQADNVTLTIYKVSNFGTP